jgi:hypothetical protein
VAVVYGANASGKSNLVKICDLIKSFITHTPLNKAEQTWVTPFLLDKTSHKRLSEFSVSFYLNDEGKYIRYVYSVALDKSHVAKETLIYYPSQQPATIFERSTENDVSVIKFGHKIKVSQAVKEEITLKCLHNMSVFAAYMQVNTRIEEVERAIRYLTNQMLPAVVPSSPLSRYAEETIEDESVKDYVLSYLQEADFNISNITIKEKDTKSGTTHHTIYQHKISGEDGENDYFEFPEPLESDGTIRTFGFAAQIQKILKKNAFLAVDELESSLHPKLIEYIVERFLKESEQAQLLLTTHYDGLLGADDLLRKDNVWFVEKGQDGSSELYPLTDFRGLNRISSIQKAYMYGKFGAVPNL